MKLAITQAAIDAATTRFTNELSVGDVLAVWWAPNHDTLLALRPYTGRLACLQGALIGEFALLPSRFMTLEPGAIHTVLVARLPPSQAKKLTKEPRRARGEKTG